ncbi:MAG: FAD-dependent monooxygenase [Anaerolineae bacterium]|nr:FAD-dependent monooxygenase [Anaerolineae bacterium]
MSEKFADTNQQRAKFGHAVVIGGSIAGLTAARVLSDTFARVTIVERDRLPDAPDFRRGTPQARHSHTLPLRGERILEEKFPGLFDELCTNGATRINGGSEMAFYLAGGWHEVKQQSTLISMTCSRPLIEHAIYQRLVTQYRVEFLQEYETVGLTVDRLGQYVTGVRLRPRHASTAEEMVLLADLVIDASGRNSQAPTWLAQLGYVPPRETIVNSFPGYSTRIYQRPANFDGAWKTLSIRPTPPNGARGGLIIPIEGDRWQVTLVGMGRDYPPTSEEGYLEFARSLPVPQLYEAIKDAQPLTRPCGYRSTENRLRHYDKLPRYLEGFLVMGDAVFALNPVYAQGMTVSVMGSVALERCLEVQELNGQEITGLAQAFQQQLSKLASGLWKMAIREDSRWSATVTTEDSSLPQHRLDKLGFGNLVRRTRSRTTTGVISTNIS